MIDDKDDDNVAPEGDEQAIDQVQTPENTEDPSTAPSDGDTGEPAGDGDTFSREYVADLRKESAGYRTQLRGVQEQLHRVLVEKTGLLADSADLPFDSTHLDDPDALTAAIEQLVADKPHLKARRFESGAAAQGAKANSGGEVNLAELMRSRL